jgi:alpha-mannosidase
VPKPLYYTFGNHMHWTDMQWLWGYEVLPSSIRDMLELVERAGVRGNVNFDGIGYEKLAAEAPAALAGLRAAVQRGVIEVVGASYGQPYGLFHGGESNVRQRVHGVRAVLRLFGVRPRAFWEEEFDCFPQLPQLLAGCGFDCASLFFQWTWHTPSVPEERHPLVTWEGLDGTRLPTLAKTELCLHQWPEDFEGRLDGDLARELDAPALVQWLELYPSPDWMCRSELLLPRLAELARDPRFELLPLTMSQLVDALGREGAPLRRYTLDDFFHGVSLGKNADDMPRSSRWCEQQLLAAEAIASLAGLFGRPYASWDVYPTWELEESWRELMSAQHHDNHECEGLCGSVGERSFDRSMGLSAEVYERTLLHLAKRVQGLEGSRLVFNPFGWSRDLLHEGGLVRDVPAFGYKVVDPYELEEPPLGVVQLAEDEERVTLSRGAFRVEIDKRRGVLSQIVSRDFPQGLLHPERALGELEMTRQGRVETFASVALAQQPDADAAVPVVTISREGRGSRVQLQIALAPLVDAVWMRLQSEALARPDGGMHQGLSTRIEPDFQDFHLLHDHPYGVSGIRADRDHVRKYPTGEWMTSPQVFETVRKPFTASRFVDLLEGPTSQPTGRGLLVVHDGGQAFFREDHGVRNLLSMYDPWDEEYWQESLLADLWFLPHGALTNTQRVHLAHELESGAQSFSESAEVQGGGELPSVFGALHVDAPNVVATALYRESARAAEGLPKHFAHGVRDPFVIRLVEYDGRPAAVTLSLPGRAAKCARTNLMGEIEGELAVEACASPFPLPTEGPLAVWSRVHLALRPHEIATVMVDLEAARAVPRNLDAHRGVWATVHRTPKPGAKAAP